jgi:PAS domain S-box-containing protein
LTNAPSPVPGTPDSPGREIEEAFYMAFRASPVAMVISGLQDGRFLEVNDQFLRLFGYDRTDVVGRTSVDLGMWANIERRRNVRERLREVGSIRDEEVSVRTKLGEIRRTLLSAEAVDLRTERVIVTSLVDVTELGAAREAKARLGAIVEGSADGIYGKTLEGRITSWNAGAEQAFGYTADEAIGRPASFLVPDDRRAELDRVMDHLRAGETIPPFETVRVRKDGRKFVASVTISPIHDEAGRRVGASAVTRDITEQKRAEQLVRRSEARFRHLFENAADAILLIDGRGTILDANPAGGALVGARDPGALRGLNLREILPSRELEKARAYLRALLHDEPAAEPFETFLQAEDGAQRFLEVRSRVIREGGVDPYVQVIARDVTADKEYQQRLLEAERRASMAQVAAFVAHEVRTPLTNIALLTASLERTVEDPHTLEKLGKIHDQRRLAANIVAELVASTRSEGVRRIETDVRGVVEAAADQASVYRQAKVLLVKELPKDPVMANVDPLRLQHALVNILKNAFQAAAKGSVTLRLETTPDSFSVGVTDTGAGMDEDVRTHLFQPFFTTKRRGEGVGLGLALAKAVVDGHHGSIAVATQPGMGSTFTIRLPRPTEPETPAPSRTKS